MNIFSASGLFDIFHASACSLPPEPTMSIFIKKSPLFPLCKRGEPRIKADFLVPEVPYARKYHGEAVFVCGLHDLFVPYRAAGLDNRGDAVLRSEVDIIPEREKGVRGEEASLLAQTRGPGLSRG